MSFLKPNISHPDAPVNDVGYRKVDYTGAISTLCAGCGHDSISGSIVQACFELNIEPHQLAKLSGIGCSSKTPTYFLSNSHGFNSVHGRMPSISTGANLANRDLIYLGVSGDGDTASIGMGQFVHAIRRNLNMTYIVMNNGCYGLTKGQDSATADFGSISKAGSKNNYNPIDLAAMAIQLDCSFVARSFSGDKEQLVPLIKAGLRHKGMAFIDVISPCVTFNNNKGSTKSYDYTREFMQRTALVDYVESKEPIEISYSEGDRYVVDLHDGSTLQLRKPTSSWRPTDKVSSMQQIMEAKEKGEVLTGLIYINPEAEDLQEKMNLSDTPMNKLSQDELCPGAKILEEINAQYR